MKNFYFALIAGIGAISSPAHATSVGVDECTIDGGGAHAGAAFTLTGATQAFCFSGSENAEYIANNAVFGISDWSLFGQIDATPLFDADGSFSAELKQATDYDGDFDFTIEDDTALNDFQLGQILASLSGLGNVFIALQSGNDFGGFLVSNQQNVWDWTSSNGISHVSIWTQGEPVSAVPLPAGGLLLLSGLALMGLRRRAH